jgi:hypothetical protein
VADSFKQLGRCLPVHDPVRTFSTDATEMVGPGGQGLEPLDHPLRLGQLTVGVVQVLPGVCGLALPGPHLCPE